MKTKIEPGCMVMVHKSYNENNGKFATAIRFVSTRPKFIHDDIWLLDTDMVGKCVGTGETITRPYMCERCLMRIDGHEEENLLREKDRERVYM